MADINIHNVKNIEIDKYQLDSGTWVCKIYITSQTKISKEEYKEDITLFAENKKTFNNIRG